MVREHIKGRGMIPKCIDKILNIVLTAVAESLVVRKRVSLLSL